MSGRAAISQSPHSRSLEVRRQQYLPDVDDIAGRAGSLVTQQVRAITELAEASATAVRRDAREEADYLRRQTFEAALRVLDHIDGVEEQLGGLVASLKREAANVATGFHDASAPRYRLLSGEATTSAHDETAASDPSEEEAGGPPLEGQPEATGGAAEAPAFDVAAEADTVEEPHVPSAGPIEPDVEAWAVDSQTAEEPETGGPSAVEPEEPEPRGVEAAQSPPGGEPAEPPTEAEVAEAHAEAPEAHAGAAPVQGPEPGTADEPESGAAHAGAAEESESGAPDGDAEASGEAVELEETEPQAAEVGAPEPDEAAAVESDAEPAAPDAGAAEPEAAEGSQIEGVEAAEPEAAEGSQIEGVEAAEPEAAEQLEQQGEAPDTPEASAIANEETAERAAISPEDIAAAESASATTEAPGETAEPNEVTPARPGHSTGESAPQGAPTRKQGILGRLRHPIRGAHSRPSECAVCARPMAGSPAELDAEGWQLYSDAALCPPCQSEGWQLSNEAQLPHRRP